MKEKESLQTTELKFVRFADDDTYHIIPIDITKFSPSRDFEDEVFGWHQGSFIAIKKEKNK